MNVGKHPSQSAPNPAAPAITGATNYLADVFLYAMAGTSPPIILSALILMMVIFTNVVSNNAAAVIGTPIAISVANDLGAPPEMFVLAVLFGANLSFVTPMAYKTNVLVMSAGDYSFGEFVKVGWPLACCSKIGSCNTDRKQAEKICI